ncbi:MAG: tRNA lysidine(34) synthetase TilS [Spirochaetota bacterium]
MNNIIQKVYTFIQNNNLIVHGDRVLVSVSAGKDSMALLHILYVIREQLGCTIAIYHLDHKMRGEESFGDLLFVMNQASRYGIPAFIERFDFVQHKEPGKSFEQQAREHRYTRLHFIAQHYGYTKIATAHTKNDQVETLIMRMVQGTGLQGLGAIALAYGTIIRPLLVLSQDEVYSYLQYNDLSYRHDNTNDDTTYLRNYIRHSVIPVIQKRFPQFDEALLTLQKQAQDAIRSIIDLMHSLYPGFIQEQPGLIQVQENAIAHSEYIYKFYCAYIISNYLKKYVNSDILDALYCAHYSKKKNVTLFEGKGIYIYRRYRNGTSFLLFSSKSLCMGDSNYEYKLPVGKTVTVTQAGITVGCAVAESIDVQPPESSTLVLRYTGCDHIVIRNKRTGDVIARKTGRRTLKRLYIDYKLTPEQKNMVPLIVINNQIAAVLFDVAGALKAEISPPFLPEKGQKMLVIRYWHSNTVSNTA